MSTLVTPEGETTCLEDFDLHTTNVSRMSHHECVTNESPRVCREWVTTSVSRMSHSIKNESRKILTCTRQLCHRWVITSVSRMSHGCQEWVPEDLDLHKTIASRMSQHEYVSRKSHGCFKCESRVCHERVVHESWVKNERPKSKRCQK